MPLFGRRAHPRERMCLQAQLVAARGARPAMLEDLSVKGARLTLAEMPAAGEDVVMRWACFAAVGRVAWVDGSACGLEFDRQLDERVVATTRAASSAGQQLERQSA